MMKNLNFENIFKAEIYINIISFFHENQGSIDTPRGVSAWTGCKRNTVEKALGDLAKIGILVAHPVSSTTGYSYTQDPKIIKTIDKRLKLLKKRRLK